MSTAESEELFASIFSRVNSCSTLSNHKQIGRHDQKFKVFSATKRTIIENSFSDWLIMEHHSLPTESSPFENNSFKGDNNVFICSINSNDCKLSFRNVRMNESKMRGMFVLLINSKMDRARSVIYNVDIGLWLTTKQSVILEWIERTLLRNRRTWRW